MKKLLTSAYFVFCLLVIIFMPLQPMFSEVLRYHSNLPESNVFWLTHWYEPILIVFFLDSFFLSRKWKKMDITAGLALVFLGIISALFLSPSLGRGIEGFRFTLLGVVFYLAARFVNLDKNKINIVINSYLVLSLLIAIWAIVERFLPLKYLGIWQVIAPDSAFGYGWHTVVGIPQSTSLLGGPNQLGSYLLPAIFISIVNLFKSFELNKKKLTVIYLFGAMLVGAAIILTFSRSATIALFATLLIAPLFVFKNKMFKIFSLISLVIMLAALGTAFLLESKSVNDLITHGGSQFGHVEALKVSLREIGLRVSQPMKLLFGSGIGTTGTIAIKYGEGIISESWYLQLVLELGMIGLILWLSFIFFVSKKLLVKKDQGLFLGLISVSIAAIFLHTFADNPALTYTLFILIGVKIKSEGSNG